MKNNWLIIEFFNPIDNNLNMIEKVKIQSIFKNFIALIVEYQNVNINMFSKISEQIYTNFSNFSKHILDLNAQFSNYQLRPDYNQDPEYIERIDRYRKDLEKEKNKTKTLKNNFEFVIGQTKLDTDKFNSLIEDLNFMIEDLWITKYYPS